MATSTQRIERTDGSAAEAELAERTQAFAGRMLQTLNEGFLTLAVSLGHRTGLFDTMAVGEPATAPEIAEAIVEHDPESGTYRLPAEHAALLTRAAGPDNLAAITQYVPVLAAVEDGIVECFRRGGGLSYTAFPRFHAVMAEESGGILDATLLQRTLPAFPGVEARLEKGASLADVGCGRGHAVNLLARAYPQSRFVGYDFSEEAIAHARAEAEAWGLENARFEVTDKALDFLGYHVDLPQAERVEEPALDFLHQTQQAWGLDEPFAELVLSWAARLHEIGLDVSHSHYQKHGAYLLEHADMPGFPQEEQRILACIVGAHRRKMHIEMLQDLSPPWHIKAEFLIVLLRLTVLLHRGRSQAALPKITLTARMGSLDIGFPRGWLEANPLTATDLENEIDYLKAVGFRLRVS